MDEKEKIANDGSQNDKSKVDASVALAIAAVVLSVLNISFSTGTGFEFGIGIISALMMGSGAAFTAFALLWDVLFIAAPVLMLVGAVMKGKDSAKARKMMVGALCSCIGIVVLDIVFGLLVRTSGLQSFSLLEMMIVYAYGSDANLITQIVIYGGALAVYLIAGKKRNPKIAIIGFAIIAAFSLITLICGLQPFAYSVGGITLFGQTVPRVTTYYLSEFASMACMWAAMAIVMSRRTNEETKNDEADETN